MTAPLFVCGVGRSGTTYLRSLLNAVPGVHLTMESRMLREGIAPFARLERSASRSAFDGALDVIATAESETRRNPELRQVVADRRDDLWDAWQVSPSFAAVGERIWSLAYDAPVWGDKLLRAEQLPRLWSVWPDARVILLLRDPRAVHASQAAKWGYSPRLSAGWWSTHVRLTEQFAAERPDAVRVVVYESLLGSPVDELAALVDVAVPGLADPAAVAAAAVAAHPPEPAALDRWRDDLDPGAIAAVEAWCWQAMVTLGYRPEQAAGPRRLSRAGYVVDNLRRSAGVVRRPSAILRKRLPQRAWATIRGR